LWANGVEFITYTSETQVSGIRIRKEVWLRNDGSHPLSFVQYFPMFCLIVHRMTNRRQ
jgi:hypothetical protein